MEVNIKMRFGRCADSPYKLYEVDPHFIEGMSKGIVAFRINSSDQENIQVASLMKKNLQKRK
ncbi:hypothetical protein AN964_01930 [Heyndrickxia shackletonii]|uniref:Uncharacterized protein n=2 Tax=Heyndrickxia TaxID=2837504 RepID=A0A0Q3WVK9_9BACI|nr:hypothetical protein [Heyndrickxia shackletonii]KQL52421.1 hypothetical protein AN964_01930 [Heyndrickxia shackletonii]